jgi:glycosyltransferase involved in cell wall biosynthesis
LLVKTLHIDTGKQMRGGQWQALYLIERLQNAVLAAPEGSELYAEAGRRKLDVRPLSFFSLRKLTRTADLVHAHDARAHTLAALAGGAPLVVSRRVGFPIRRSPASRWKYACAASYLAISKYVAARLMDAGVRARKIHVVYDGVPIPFAAQPDAGRVIALREKFVNAGDFPVHFTTDLWQDLSTANVFVYSSELEGLGSAVIAAMAAGVPVVASGSGGLRELIEHEKTGFLVETGEISEAVERLLKNPRLAAEMGERARHHVLATFTVEKMVSATVRVYREVLGC